MKKPLVTVLLPTYNSADTVQRSIKSVLRQTFKDFLLLVLDDGSTDNTEFVINEIRDKRVKYVKLPHAGLGRTLNFGIDQSEGRFIARIDADDIALKDRLQKQVDFMSNNDSISVLGTSILVKYADGTGAIRKRASEPLDVLRNAIRVCPVVHPTVLMRSRDVMNIGGYDINYDGSLGRSIGMDYHLWIRMLAKGYKIANLDEPLTIHHKSTISIQGKKSLAYKLRERKKIRIWAAKQLGVGWTSYFDIASVELFTILSHFGYKLDSVFNVLGKKQTV